MVRKKNTFWNNGWTIAIGAVIFAFILSVLKDLITKEPFLTTLKSVTVYTSVEPKKTTYVDSSKLKKKPIPVIVRKDSLLTPKPIIYQRKVLKYAAPTSRNKDTSVKHIINAKNIVTAPNYGNQQVGDNNTMIITSDKFVEPSENLKSLILENLKKLTTSSSKNPKILIWVESGDNIRSKVATELESFLNEYDAGIYPKGNTISGFAHDYPVTIILNPINTSYANEFIKSINPLMTFEYHFQYSDNFSPEWIKFFINGKPTFDQTGRITIN